MTGQWYMVAKCGMMYWAASHMHSADAVVSRPTRLFSGLCALLVGWVQLCRALPTEPAGSPITHPTTLPAAARPCLWATVLQVICGCLYLNLSR